MSRILVVDDKENMLSMFTRILPDHDVVTVSDGAEALGLIAAGEEFDVVVSDIQMPKVNGLTLLKEVKNVHPDVEVILMTAYAEVADAVEAMKSGAYDYFVKPFDPDEAVLVVEKALEVRNLRSQTRRLQTELEHARGFGPFVGTSLPIQRVYALIDKAAASEVNVLIEGESGTGKELVARSIHERSARSDGPFIAVNCGALPADLVESELFGHVKGAFTGAITGKSGLFEDAVGGTMFLDEINALPLVLQVKLNRAIEEREARRVGDNKTYRIDVRLLCATNADLHIEVKEERFREDLFFRIHVLSIQLPPLRNRKADIPLLAAHFLKCIDGSVSDFVPDTLKALMAYDWPGNVRELRNCIESAAVVAEGTSITTGDLPRNIVDDSMPGISAEHLASLTYQEALDLARDRMLKQYLLALMKAFKGKVTAAASQAGVERETLHRLLKKHSIDPSSFRQ